MQRILFFIFCFVFSFSAQAKVVQDDLGNVLYLSKPAERVVSLAPDITEILFAIDAGAKIVGVVSGSDFPQAACQKTIVGAYNGIDLEKILALHPDLIVTWNNTFTRQLNVFKKLGIPIYVTNPHYLENIPRTMQHLGELVGREAQANQAAARFLQRLSQLRFKYQAKKAISVFYQMSSYSLMTVNKESWINQVITLCGGRNVFADAHSIAPEIAWEALVRANPDVILSGAINHDWQMRFKEWTQLTAVKNQHLFLINPDWIGRAGPRLLDAAEQVCQCLEIARASVIARKA